MEQSFHFFFHISILHPTLPTLQQKKNRKRAASQEWLDGGKLRQGCRIHYARTLNKSHSSRGWFSTTRIPPKIINVRHVKGCWGRQQTQISDNTINCKELRAHSASMFALKQQSTEHERRKRGSDHPNNEHWSKSPQKKHVSKKIFKEVKRKYFGGKCGKEDPILSQDSLNFDSRDISSSSVHFSLFLLMLSKQNCMPWNRPFTMVLKNPSATKLINPS